MPLSKKNSAFRMWLLHDLIMSLLMELNYVTLKPEKEHYMVFFPHLFYLDCNEIK